MKKISLRSLKLAKGSHSEAGKEMCVMEAVAYFNNEPHSDHPQCACPVLTAYMIGINDSMNDVERKMLRPYIKQLIGTRDGNSQKRAEILARHSVCRITPHALELTGIESLKEVAANLKSLFKNGTFKEMESAAESAKSAAWSAAGSAAGSAVCSAACSAAESADRSAKSAAWSAACSADRSAWSAAWSAACSAAESADRSAKSAAWSARTEVWKLALRALDEALVVGKSSK